MKPLPTITYQLLSETQLRKKLRELGIPADGNKQSMMKRHTEWRNLVNANCDSSKPKSKSDLLRELQQWERTQNVATNSSASKSNKHSVMEKDFDRDAWSTSHSNDFQSLIAAARAKKKVDNTSEEKSLQSSKIVPILDAGTTIPDSVENTPQKSPLGSQIIDLSRDSPQKPPA
jgi:E3 ubiquitin-protein ligase RAD18